jgi:hypothetical protein
VRIALYRFFRALGVARTLPKQSQFKTLDEFDQAIDSLIAILIAEHHPEEAQRLYTLLRQTTWTTSSELLRELLLALTPCRNAIPPRSSKLSVTAGTSPAITAVSWG